MGRGCVEIFKNGKMSFIDDLSGVALCDVTVIESEEEFRTSMTMGDLAIHNFQKLASFMEYLLGVFLNDVTLLNEGEGQGLYTEKL
jgi:hypothetical protein